MTLTETDIKDAIADLKALIREAASRKGSGKIAEIKALRERKQHFESLLK